MFTLPPESASVGLTVRLSELSDAKFFRMVYETARLDAPVLALWPSPEREAFLDEQFRFQDIHFRRFYPDADYLVVEQNSEPIGRLILDSSGREWLIVDIAILPGSRGKGIGARLLRAIQLRASASAASSVRLEVEIFNERARKLYARLGFVEVDAPGAHIAMAWRC
jgi:ribosomal protein S18 acetylase RimI-like enzyme